MLEHKVLGRMKSTDQVKTGRTIALVGLMGAGKSAIGRRLGIRLGLNFTDADVEIERSAGKTISDIFKLEGEKEFRMRERKILKELLARPAHVLATGGGAFIDVQTRRLIRKKALSIWLKADLKTLHERVVRRTSRPLLAEGNPKEILAALIDERYPIYRLADVVIESIDCPHEEIVDKVVDAIMNYDRSHELTAGECIEVGET